MMVDGADKSRLVLGGIGTLISDDAPGDGGALERSSLSSCCGGA